MVRARTPHRQVITIPLEAQPGVHAVSVDPLGRNVIHDLAHVGVRPDHVN